MTEEDIATFFQDQQCRLIAYGRGLVRDSHLAQDLVQDTCLKAMEMMRQGGFGDEEHLRRWTFRTIKHRAIDWIRKCGDRERFFGEELMEKLESLEVEPNAQSPISDTEESRLRSLRQCLQKLTPRMRRVLAMKFGEDLPGADIAKLLNRQVDSVYKALSRSYLTLRNCIESSEHKERPA